MSRWKRPWRKLSPAELQSRQARSSEAGDTLVEVLLSIVILGIAGMALLLGFGTAITSSAEHRNLVTLDASVRAATQQVIAQVQQAGDAAFGPCPHSYTPDWSLSGSFTVTDHHVWYWDGTSFNSGTACTPYGPQQWTMTISNGKYDTTVSTVIYDPGAPAVTGGTTPSQLVFLQVPNAGTLNAPVTPQPIVAVEDANGNIVNGDVSSVTLQVASGPGHLSNNCSGTENQGVVSFGDCSLDTVGTYLLKAVDSRSGVTPAVMTTPFDVVAAPPAKLAFTSSPVTGQVSQSAGLGPITVQEQDAFGNPTPGALTVTLSSSSAKGVFALTQNGAPVTSVSIPAGQSSVSFYYGDTVAGTPTLTASATGIAAGTQDETLRPGPPTQLVFASDPFTVMQSTSADTQFTVAVADQFGNPTSATSSTTVHLSSTSPTARFSGSRGGSSTSSVTIQSGQSQRNAYYGDNTIGTPTITASASGLGSVSQQETIVARPVKLVFITGPFTGGASSTGNLGPIAVQELDSNGNPTTAAMTVTLNSTSSRGVFSLTPGGSSVGSVDIAGGSSTATFYYGDTRTGTPTITASASGLSSATQRETITAGPLDHFALTDPGNQTAGGSFTEGISAVDAFGNAVTSYTGAQPLAFSGPSTSPAPASAAPSYPGTVTFTNGVGSATITLYAAEHTTLTATAGLISGTSPSFTVNAGPTVGLNLPNPGTQSAGTQYTQEIDTVDQYDNTTNYSSGYFGDTVNFSGPHSAPDGTPPSYPTGSCYWFGCTGNVDFNNGVAEVHVTLFDAETTNLAASDGSWSGSTGPFTVTSGPLNSVSVPTPSTQTAGTPFAVTINGSDNYGNAASGSLGVTFSGPSNSPAPANRPPSYPGNVTFTNGTGSATITLYDAQSTRLTVSTSAGSATTGFFTVNPATASQVAITPNPTSAGASSTTNVSLAMQLQDLYDNTTTSSGTTTLTLSTSSSKGFFSNSNGGTGTLGGTATVTFGNGVGTRTEYYGDENLGNPVITGKNGSTTWGTTTVTINPGPPALVVITPNPASAGASNTTNVALGLQLVDQFGNATTSSGTTTLALSTNSSKGFFSNSNGGTGTLGGTATVTFGNGVGTRTEYYGDENLGNPVITAKNGSTTWGTTSVTIGPGAPAQVTITRTPTSAGDSATTNIALGLQLKDQFGNDTTSSGTTSLTLSTSSSRGFFATTSGGSGSLGGTATVTFADGVGTATAYYGDENAGTPTITAKNGATSWGTATVTITAGPAAQVAITPSPTSATASATTNVALGLQLQDQFANNVTSSGTTTLTLSTSSTKGFFAGSNGASGTLGGTATVSFGTGVGTRTEYYGDETAGSPTITATNGTPWGTTGVTVTAKTTGDTLTKVQGDNQTATVSTAFGIALGVRDVDEFNNPVPNVSVTFSAPSSGASGTFGTCAGGNPQSYSCVVTTDANGYATASTLTANTRSGSGYSVTTSASGVASPPSFTESNAAGPASQVVITANPASASASNTTNIALGMQLTDQYGNNVSSSGTTLALTSTSSRGFFAASNSHSGTASLGVTFTNGAATAYYGDEAAGSPTITAKSGANTWGSTSVIITPKTTGDSLTIVQGDGQSTPVHTAFGTALEVRDLDQFGNPVPGVDVTFSAPSSGASGTFDACARGNPQAYSCVVATDANGYATASTLTANATRGSYSVSTSASGVASPPNFSETNTRRNLSATSVASGTSSYYAGNDITTSSFSMTSGSTYVVTAFASSYYGSLTPPSLSVPGNPAATLVTTNDFSGGSDCRDSAGCVEWTWWFNANTTNANATVSLSFPGYPTAEIADVIELSGNNTTSPIVQSSVASGCDRGGRRSGCANRTTTVTGDLTSTPAPGDITLQFLGSDDQMGSTPTWSPDDNNLYFSDGTGTGYSAALDVNVSTSGQQSETTSTSGWPSGGGFFGGSSSRDWGTITLEIGAG